jgi:tRNA(fMet)-specific endonuclease VapC
MFLLDTDHISILQHASGAQFTRLTTRIRAFREGDFFFSVISFHEQALGWNTYISNARDTASVLRGYRGYEDLIAQYAPAHVVAYDHAAVARFDSLRAQRVRIGTFDLRIAAIALSHDLTLLSRNLADFRQVSGLQVQDWAQ